MRLLIERIGAEEKQTIGRLYVLNPEDFVIFDCWTLELPWRNNKTRISCIPTGKYKVYKHTSPTFGKSLWINPVPGRSEILVHGGNFHFDTLGCILPGMDLREINGDGLLDVTSSKKALTEILDLVPDQITLEIIDTYEI